MLDTIRRILAPVPAASTQRALDRLFETVADRLNSVTLQSGALAIKAGGSELVKVGSRWEGLAGGIPLFKAANTDMAALSGTVTNAKFNVFCYFCTAAGTLSTVMGVEGATYAAVKFPEKPIGSAMIGYTLINPTGTGNFVGGTTPIDDATVAPNAVHVNTVGASDPNFLLS